MTATTTQHASPATTPRTARRIAALPNDPGLDAILADPNLSSTAKALITVMVRNWAWVKDHCWPSDATLAAKVGMSVGHVQRCLRELELAGRIVRERTDAVPNGRRIWLLWRCPGGRAGARRDPAPARTAPAAPARSERVVIVNEGREPEIRPASRRRPEADPVPTALLDAPPPAASTSQAEELPEPLGPLLTVPEARETPPAPMTEGNLHRDRPGPPWSRWWAPRGSRPGGGPGRLARRPPAPAPGPGRHRDVEGLVLAAAAGAAGRPAGSVGDPTPGRCGAAVRRAASGPGPGPGRAGAGRGGDGRPDPGGRAGAAHGAPGAARAAAADAADGRAAGDAPRPARPDHGGGAAAERGDGGLPAGEPADVREDGRGGGVAVGAGVGVDRLLASGDGSAGGAQGEGAGGGVEASGPPALLAAVGRWHS